MSTTYFSTWQVCFEAVKATTAFIVNNEKEPAVYNHLKDLLPLLIQVLILSYSVV